MIRSEGSGLDIMEKRQARRNLGIAILSVLILITIAFIFSNSMETPKESQEKSQLVTKLLMPILEWFVGEGNVTEHMVRKLAHFTEFGLLGCELALLLILYGRIKLQTVINITTVAFLIAVLDETIQIASQRGSSLLDVWLDTAGAVTGILGSLFLYAGIQWAIRFRKRKDT